MKKEYIDITPSWVAIAPILVHILIDGDKEAHETAMESIMNMAKLADAYVAHLKAIDAQVDELAKAEQS